MVIWFRDGSNVYPHEIREKELMATYEYECDEGHYNIQERPMAEEQTIFSCSAPECNANLKRIYNSPPAMFKGRGFYSTGG